MARQIYDLAVGLQYEDGTTDAPAVTLKEEELSADEVVKLAKRFGVAVVEDEELAQSLHPLEIDRPIPPALYKAVAILFQRLRRLVRSTMQHRYPE